MRKSTRHLGRLPSKESQERVQHGNSIERNTSVGPSPKKFKVDVNIIIPLEEVKKKEEFDRVSVKVEVLETTTVSTGKKVQDVFVGDANTTMRCTLWEGDMGGLKVGRSYCLKKFLVHKYCMSRKTTYPKEQKSKSLERQRSM